MPRAPEAKIQDAASCLAVMRACPDARWVFTNGCFDILHAGHAHYLHQARLLGGGLIVGLNSDASIRRIKGASRPIVPCQERALLLAALECVDIVVSFDEDDPCALLSLLRPAIHAKGGDYTAELLPEYSLVRSWGGEVRILPFVAGCSTSALVQRIRAAE